MRELIAYFFGTFPVNSRGRQTGFKTGDEPTQNRFQELFDSIIFPSETKYRARQQAADDTFDKDEVGIVTIATDVKAKSNGSGLQADHTIVPHTGQLPTVAEGDTVDYGGPSGAIQGVDVTVDPGTTTRNNFKVSVTQALVDEIVAIALGGVPAGGETNTGSNVGGGAEVFKQKSGVDFEYRTLQQGTGIIVSQGADDIQIQVDDVYINSLISGSGGGGSGPAESNYLFRAEKLADQTINTEIISGSGIYQDTVLFEDDINLPNYDYGGSWGISKFQHGNASDVALRHILEMDIENTDAGAHNYDLMIVKEDAPITEISSQTGLNIGQETINISTVDVISNVATITTTVAHGLVTDQVVDILGTSVGGANGTNKKITVTGTTTFTYSVATPDASGNGGTVTPHTLELDLSLKVDECYFIKVEDDGNSVYDDAPNDYLSVDFVSGGIFTSAPVLIPADKWNGTYFKLLPSTISATPQTIEITSNGGLEAGEKFTGDITIYDSGMQVLASISGSLGATTTETKNLSTALVDIPNSEKVRVILEADAPGVLKANTGGIFRNVDS